MNKNLYVENVGLNQEGRIIDLAKSLHHHRIQNPCYGNYLLEEYPDTFMPIAQDLICTLEKDPHNHRLYMICKGTQKDLGYILMKNYSEKIIDDPVTGNSNVDGTIPNLEASYRTTQSGLCSDALRHVIMDLFTSPNHSHIKVILGHHAKDNIASGMVFHGNGFAGLRYHQDYVNLPNLNGGEMTDTIMWRLDMDTFHSDISKYACHLSLKKYLKNNPVRIKSPNGCGPKIQHWRDSALLSKSAK
ncbi:MAG: hypothetical protein V3575_00100 [Candidatus Absconditabacteria bacterium]